MKFADEMKKTVIEREVEDVYNKGISFYFPNVDITHPFECDGFIDTKVDDKMLKLIFEYKYDKELTTRIARANVMVQVLYYMKKFEVNGMILPNVCMVGDKNECFVFHTNDIMKYLDYNLDWNIAPSEAYKKNADLVLDMVNDDALNPFIFVINESFDFGEVVEKIKDLAKNVQRYVHVTEHNIATIFEYFKSNVIKDKKITANELVSVFLGIIKNDNDYYVHPSKKNILIANKKEYQINGDGYKSFSGYFNRVYTPQEKMRFDEISDRLIEDTNRRKKGEFYTPTIFVDYAHKMISEQFGEDWKEKYVVWDNCCGSCNLTRDYKFNELYCSTLEDSELEIGKRYNQEAVKFQFDFLNDYIPMSNDVVEENTKMPNGLMQALKENKPMIFFINPPYATAGVFGKNSKKDIANTHINKKMKEDKIGACSQNLYAQFLYRIIMLKKAYNLTNVHICLFSPSLYLTGGSWEKFRKVFLNEFAYNDGIIFKASHFADVADSWGISFTIWNNGKTENKNEFIHNIVDMKDGEIVVLDNKDVYNIDGVYKVNNWVKECVKNLKTFDIPNFSSGVKIKNGIGKNFLNNYGYFFLKSNNIDKNVQEVALFSGAFSDAHGFGINTDNYLKVTSLFTARKTIDKNWINWADEYMKPNTEHIAYGEYEADSIVYSLFNSKSQQSSLRDIDYKGKKWNIYNHFFWMSKNEMMELASQYNNDDVYNDARTDKERYTYEMIEQYKSKMSKEALDVLNKATELVIKSFKYRELFNQDNMEYQINNWDCGYYQMKPLWKQYFEEDFNEFRELYKKLTEKLRPQVYELGFLK